MNELLFLKMVIIFAAIVILWADRISPWTKLIKFYTWKKPRDPILKWKDICGDPTSKPKHKASTYLLADSDGFYFIERYRIPFLFWGRKAFIPWNEIKVFPAPWPYYKIELQKCTECSFVFHEKDWTLVKAAISDRFSVVI